MLFGWNWCLNLREADWSYGGEEMRGKWKRVLGSMEKLKL